MMSETFEANQYDKLGNTAAADEQDMKEMELTVAAARHQQQSSGGYRPNNFSSSTLEKVEDHQFQQHRQLQQMQQQQQRGNSYGVHSPIMNDSAAAMRRSMSGSPTRDGLPSSLNAMCGGNTGLALAQSKLDSLKTWSISTYKCTRQALQEKLGKTNRTVDVELEQSIDALRDVQTRYNNLAILARSLSAHFANVLQTQKQMGDCFMEMAAREIDLRDEFTCNGETQKVIAKNGERLLTALNFFISSLATLCDKTIEDTITTIRVFETARLEYDADRHDLEQLQSTQTRGPDFQHRLHEVEQQCQQQKVKYEQLRDDVQVKMKFLHENKVKVMQKQLVMFHNATSAFYSGNNQQLEAVLKQFSVKNDKNLRQPGTSWLEG